MPGTLHVFRLRADPPQYQMNYNVGAASWVQVFTATGLEEFLRHGTGIPPVSVDAMLDELRGDNPTTETNVELSEGHLSEMGFVESSSDE